MPKWEYLQMIHWVFNATSTDRDPLKEVVLFYTPNKPRVLRWAATATGESEKSWTITWYDFLGEQERTATERTWVEPLDLMEELGEESWELVSTILNSSLLMSGEILEARYRPTIPVKTTYIFKRPKI